jgi:hypothetical protein
MGLSVTISRDGADLVIGDHPNDGAFWIPEDGITWPSFAMRRTYVPDSAEIGGRHHRAAVPDEGQVSLTVYVHATTLALLLTAMDELEAATSQFDYDLTVTVDGSMTRTWRAKSELPQWGQFDSGKTKAKLISGTITIPLNPIGAS